MSGDVLFEQFYRGDMWRFEIAEHNGRTFFNCRKWYRKADTLHPTREGFTMSLERLPELHEALGSYLAMQRSSGPEIAS